MQRFVAFSSVLLVSHSSFLYQESGPLGPPAGSHEIPFRNSPFLPYFTSSPTPTGNPASDTTRSMGVPTEACQMIGGLTQKQRAVCAESPALIPIILQGINKAISKCQKLFEYRRWNCSSYQLSVVFGKKRRPQLPGNRERAIMHAMASAGVMDIVAHSCYLGNLTACSPCSPMQMGSNAAYEWGSCSSTIIDSAHFAKRMLDARESSYTPLSALNLHNNEVGRLTTYEMINKQCRCHGSTGSCSVQTCWNAYPSYDRVSKRLFYKYNNALLAVEKRNKSGMVKLAEADQPSKRLVSRRSTQDAQEPTSLYYLKESPSYCDPDPTSGSLGTTGRKCYHDARNKWEDCEFLCCGRGYRTETTTIQVDCECEFEFCCSVKCKTCDEIVQQHFCL